MAYIRSSSTYSRAPALAMASFASPPPLPPLLPPSHHRPTRPSLITCGPRDGRPQLARGRMLSSEAILAVQALKRAARHHHPSDLPPVVSATLARLLKPDLLAALRELLRQGRTDLALLVLAAARREPWYRPDYGLYAEVVAAMARDGMEVGGLIREVAAEGLAGGDETGLGRLVRAAIAAGSGGAVVALWGMMKEGGWACEERLGRALSRGLIERSELQGC